MIVAAIIFAALFIAACIATWHAYFTNEDQSK